MCRPHRIFSEARWTRTTISVPLAQNTAIPFTPLPLVAGSDAPGVKCSLRHRHSRSTSTLTTGRSVDLVVLLSCHWIERELNPHSRRVPLSRLVLEIWRPLRMPPVKPTQRRIGEPSLLQRHCAKRVACPRRRSVTSIFLWGILQRQSCVHLGQQVGDAFLLLQLLQRLGLVLLASFSTIGFLA